MTDFNEEVKSEIKGISDAVEATSKQVTASIESNDATIKGLSEDIKKQNDNIEKFSAFIQSQGLKGQEVETQELSLKYDQAFYKLMRSGDSADIGIASTELKSMIGEYSDAMVKLAESKGEFDTACEIKAAVTNQFGLGGALVPLTFSSGIIKKQRDFSDVRRYARVQTSDVGGLLITAEDEDSTFNWVGELESTSDATHGTFGDVEIPMNEAEAKIVISNKMAMNKAFNMVSHVQATIADRISRGEGSAFTTGTGTKTPKGFMSYASGTSNGQIQQVVASTSTSLVYEDFVSLETQLRGVYRRGAAFIMNRFTLGEIKKIKSTDGVPLFSQGNVAENIASTILGYPVIILDDMAGASTSGVFTANDLVVAFGNLNLAYTVLDLGAGMRVVQDNSVSGGVRWKFTKFTGGGVHNGDALKILKIKA